MGDNGDDESPFMRVTLGATEVAIQGGSDDDLEDVRGQLDHALDRALDGAERLDEVGPI